MPRPCQHCQKPLVYDPARRAWSHSADIGCTQPEPRARQRIREEWDDYVSLVLPELDEVKDGVQLLETKKAFYAGAHCMLQVLLLGVSEGAEPQPEDTLLLAEIEQEIAAFVQSVGRPARSGA